MIMKKKWDEKGKTMQFEVKTRDGKSTFYRKTRKEVKESEKQQCPKKIRFEEFWEVWQLSHARGNIAYQNIAVLWYNVNVSRTLLEDSHKDFQCFMWIVYYLFFNILHLLHFVWPGGRSKTYSLISQISHFCQKIKKRSFFPFFLKAFVCCFSSAGFLKILQIVYCKYFDSCDLVKVSLNDPEKPFDHPGYSYQLKDCDSMDLKWCQRTDDCYKSCGNFPLVCKLVEHVASCKFVFELVASLTMIHLVGREARTVTNCGYITGR